MTRICRLLFHYRIARTTGYKVIISTIRNRSDSLMKYCSLPVTLTPRTNPTSTAKEASNQATKILGISSASPDDLLILDMLGCFALANLARGRFQASMVSWVRPRVSPLVPSLSRPSCFSSSSSSSSSSYSSPPWWALAGTQMPDSRFFNGASCPDKS